jgi:hypothetical protein
VSVLVVCCAEQEMGEYMEAHDRLATGLASWCLCIGRPHVLLPCVGLGSFACPLGSNVFVRDGWSLAMLCVHVCIRAVDSGGTAMDQSVRVLCPPTHLLCITASLVHVLMPVVGATSKLLYHTTSSLFDCCFSVASKAAMHQGAQK